MGSGGWCLLQRRLAGVHIQISCRFQQSIATSFVDAIPSKRSLSSVKLLSNNAGYTTDVFARQSPFSKYLRCSSCPSSWSIGNNGPTRGFSGFKKGGSGGYKMKNINRNGKKNVASGPILNDDLLKALRRLKVSSVRVRLEINEEDKMTPEVMTIDEAFRLAEEYQLDIISVALNAEIPVVKIEDHNRALYQAKKLAKEKNKLKPKTLPVKEIKFKAGIDENDLQRKINNVVSYLEKGHHCQITVISAFRRAIANDKIVDETYERVYAHLEDFVKDPQLAGKRQNWRHKSVTLRPKDNLATILENRC